MSKSRRTRPSPFRVRRATVKDLDALVHQRRAMWEDMGVRDRRTLDLSDDAYRRWAKSRIMNEELLGWIVLGKNSEVAGGGCVWLQPIQPRPGLDIRIQPYLLSMFTEPEYRGKGVASLIVTRALSWARKNGYPWLGLHSSDKGRSLYKRYGFKRTWEMKHNLTRRDEARTRALRL